MLGQFTNANWRRLVSWLADGILPRQLMTNGPTPAASAGAHLGSGSVTIVPGSSDCYGEVGITPGTGTAAGEQVKITLTKPVVDNIVNGSPWSMDPHCAWAFTTPPSGVQVYGVLNGTDSFSIYFSGAGSVGTQYWVTYLFVMPNGS